jgi:hypothetical protein
MTFKINPKLLFVLTALFPLLMAVAVRGEPDDDDSNLLVELITDIVSGYLAGVCMKNSTCAPILFAVGSICLLITLLAWIAEGCSMPSLTGRDARRAATSYLGMRLAN